MPSTAARAQHFGLAAEPLYFLTANSLLGLE